MSKEKNKFIKSDNSLGDLFSTSPHFSTNFNSGEPVLNESIEEPGIEFGSSEDPVSNSIIENEIRDSVVEIDNNSFKNQVVSSDVKENLSSLNFDMPKHISSVIKVIGVGGGGSNAVNHMINEGIKGVDFIICNTDAQALEMGHATTKIQLGMSLTEGLGAGENPSVGEQAAVESEKEIIDILKTNTKMVFVTAGMGGGTGTGAAPVIARICKDLNILTIGIVTVPFSFEGPKRFQQAQDGIDKMREYVDSLVVINNDKLVEVYGDLGLRSGFAKADETLMVAARGIAEVITQNCLVNIDLNDAKTVLQNSGTAIMGSGKASGPNRAQEVVEKALDSPLLNDNHIKGSNKILLLIISGKKEITIKEIDEINHYLQREAGGQANIILGVGDDPTMEEDISITIIATGVVSNCVDPTTGLEERTIHQLNEEEQEPSELLVSNNEINEEEHDNDLSVSNNVINEEERTIHQLNEEEQEPSELLFKNNTVNKDDTDVERDALINANELNLEEEKTTPRDTSSIHVKNRTVLSEKIVNEPPLDLSEQNIKIAEERKKRLQKFHNLNFQNQVVLKELEDEPAYKRQGLELDEVDPSYSSTISRVVLDSSQEDLELRNKNNSFLHDNVD